ncbi:MAG: site-specific integrase [Clostridia bacterium]|nr:site-specific integrase [Clostridia bacterium]
MIAAYLRDRNGVYYTDLRYTDADGKRRQECKTTGLKVKGNKHRAEVILEERSLELEKRLFLKLNPEEAVRNEKEIAFTVFLRNWLEIVRPTVEETTFGAYHSAVANRIIPYFDERYPGLRLVDLTPKMIQDYYSYELSHNGVSANTIKHRHANIHRALGYAFKTGLLDVNPADRVDLPKKNVFETEPYTEKDIMQLFEAVKDTPLELIVILTAFYGLRREEVLGLKWNAVDFDNHTITIKSVVTEAYLDGKCQLVEKNRTKTKSSFRTLPLVPQIESLLRQAKAQQEEYRELCGDCYNMNYIDYVNVNPMGDLIKPGYVSQQFPIFLKRAGLRKIRFHDLRHSCATLMYAKGVKLKDMQIWLGHSTISTTSNIYTHLDFDSKLDSANAILGVLTDVSVD